MRKPLDVRTLRAVARRLRKLRLVGYLTSWDLGFNEALNGSVYCLLHDASAIEAKQRKQRSKR